MALPQKTAIPEDQLPLDRALQALDEAKASLKVFSQLPSVHGDVELRTVVEAVRDKIRQARKRARDVRRVWNARLAD